MVVQWSISTLILLPSCAPRGKPGITLGWWRLEAGRREGGRVECRKGRRIIGKRLHFLWCGVGNDVNSNLSSSSSSGIMPYLVIMFYYIHLFNGVMN